MHKRLTVLVLAVLVTIVVAKRKHNGVDNKANDWDELESLLKRIDQDVDETTPIKSTNNGQTEHSGETPIFMSRGEKSTLNPCENHHCGWGKECVVTAHMKPKCECIRKCSENPNPALSDLACSNHNQTYDSICHLYRERCLCRRNQPGCSDYDRNKHLHVEYMGQCKELEKCTKEHLEMFATRMASWLFEVMRDLKKRQELNGDQWVRMIEEAEHDDRLKHVYPVIWKFCELDNKPHDKSVSHHELIPITAPIIPMESCIKPFLKGCDANDDDMISLKEWGKCLGLTEEDIIERC